MLAAKGRPDDVRTLLGTLAGIVNRNKPRIYFLDGSMDDGLWLNEMAAPQTKVNDPLALVSKYKGEVAGVIIYDDALKDTINLATTMAGQMGGIVASPAGANHRMIIGQNPGISLHLRDYAVATGRWPCGSTPATPR